MTEDEINKIINFLIVECVKLRNKYITEENPVADYICIFSHSQSEYEELLKIAEKLGWVVDETPTGPVFAFNNRPITIAGSPKILKVRKPDETRPQRGDVDFNTNYEVFKRKYLDNKNFSLIKRVGSEMIELKDNQFNVLAYFSNVPPSKQLGIA